MAGTINYVYDPNQDVYVINVCNGNLYVTQGEVLRVRAEVLVTETTLKYDIRLTGNTGTAEFGEADVFPDVATAMAEYELRVG